MTKRLLAGLTLLTIAAVGCAADKRSREPEPPPSSSVQSDVAVYEFIGEVDVASNKMTIRPALPNEMQSPGIGEKSWNRISASGVGTSSVSISAYNPTTTPGDVSTVGIANPYPVSYTCAAGHQCSWMTVTQPAGSQLKLGNAIAVIYNISNGVTLSNAEQLPYPTPLYASKSPAGSAYLHYPGGTAWSTFRWDGSKTNAFSRAWDFNLNSATSFTFNFQVNAIVDRSYAGFTGPTPISSFTDACATGVSYFDFSAGGGRNKAARAITLDFPFSLYDSQGADGPATIQTLKFHVDGALSVGDDVGLHGEDDDPASILSNDLPGYVILPYYANLTTAKASGQLCYASLGTAPLRTAVFTWKNMTFEVDPTNAAKATFSAILHEGSDQIDFQYLSVTPPTRAIASTGIKKDSVTYDCMVTDASGCVVDVNAAGKSLDMVQYSISPAGPLKDDDWRPTDMTGCKIWFSSQVATSITTSGSSVTGWANQCITGPKASQSKATAEPTYAAPIIHFDGTSDGLDMGTSSVVNGAVTVGMRFRFHAATGAAGAGNSLLTLVEGASAQQFFEVSYINGLSGYTTGYGFTNLTSFGTASTSVAFSNTADTNWHTLIVTQTGSSTTSPSSWTASLDGVKQTLANSGPFGQVTPHNSLGARDNGAGPFQSFAPVEYAEITVFDSVLAGADYDKLVNYLAVKSPL